MSNLKGKTVRPANLPLLFTGNLTLRHQQENQGQQWWVYLWDTPTYLMGPYFPVPLGFGFSNLVAIVAAFVVGATILSASVVSTILPLATCI